MCGQRDSDGDKMKIVRYLGFLNLPIYFKVFVMTMKIYNPNEHGNIFYFHKGCPILYQKNPNGELAEIKQYNGWGTVEILVELINNFCPEGIVAMTSKSSIQARRKIVIMRIIFFLSEVAVAKPICKSGSH